MANSKTVIGIFCAVALVVLFAVTAFIPSASAADIYSGDSIQAAINAAVPGEIITVHDGTYEENLMVNKSDIVIRSATGYAVTTLRSTQADMPVISITDQTNVTLDGFTIRDAYGETQDVAGIYMENANGCSISNNTLTDISATDPMAYGIELMDSHNNRFCSIMISRIYSDEVVDGILIRDSTNNSFNSDLTVSSVHTPGYYACGIEIWGSHNNSFNSNITVSNVNATEEVFGILIIQSDNNTFYSSVNVSQICGPGNIITCGIGLGMEATTNAFEAPIIVSYINGTTVVNGLGLHTTAYNSFSSSIAISHLSGTNTTGALGLYKAHNNTFTGNITIADVVDTGNLSGGIGLGLADANSFNSDITISQITGTDIAGGIGLNYSRNNTFNGSITVSHITAGNIAGGIGLVNDSTHNSFGSSITISHINASYIACGIGLVGSDDNEFRDCTISDLAAMLPVKSIGIGMIDSSDGNRVIRSTIFSGINLLTRFGVYIRNSYNDLISDSKITYCGHGILLNHSWLINVSGNEIRGNNHGVQLNYSHNTTIARNMIVNNTAEATGVHINTDSDDNEIHENCFFYNVPQALDNGLGNNWSGNFWSDYTPPPPYTIEGTADSTDANPLDECPFEEEPLTITILSPAGKTYASLCVKLTFIVDPKGTELDWIGYSLDGGANVTITGNTTIGGLSAGDHTLVVYANDTLGNTVASNTVQFTVHPADINFDGWVYVADNLLFAQAYGSRPGDVNWNPDADFTCDGWVYVADNLILAQNYGTVY